MWIATNTGFVSVVADRNNPDRLLVRARRKQDLENVLAAYPFCHEQIFEDTKADYRWRIFLDRKMVAEVVSRQIMKIGYGNFKNSVKDDDLHDMYAEMWGTHYTYQKNDPATRRKR